MIAHSSAPRTSSTIKPRGRRAGPETGSPLSTSNLAPWQPQAICSPFTPLTMQPAWVQVASKARKTPSRGCVTKIVRLASIGNLVPEPTGTSDAAPSNSSPLDCLGTSASSTVADGGVVADTGACSSAEHAVRAMREPAATPPARTVRRSMDMRC